MCCKEIPVDNSLLLLKMLPERKDILNTADVAVLMLSQPLCKRKDNEDGVTQTLSCTCGSSFFNATEHAGNPYNLAFSVVMKVCRQFGTL